MDQVQTILIEYYRAPADQDRDRLTKHWEDATMNSSGVGQDNS